MMSDGMTTPHTLYHSQPVSQSPSKTNLHNDHTKRIIEWLTKNTQSKPIVDPKEFWKNNSSKLLTEIEFLPILKIQ